MSKFVTLFVSGKNFKKNVQYKQIDGLFRIVIGNAKYALKTHFCTVEQLYVHSEHSEEYVGITMM